MPLRRSTSCEFISFSHGAEYRQERFKERRTRSARKKSVQWSIDLEEVRYFVPHRSRSESIKRKFKKVKKRAEQLNDNLKNLKGFTSSAESRTTRLRIIGRYAKCFSHESGLQSFEEYNKQWDLLFEMYASRENYSLEATSTKTLWNSYNSHDYGGYGGKVLSLPVEFFLFYWLIDFSENCPNKVPAYTVWESAESEVVLVQALVINSLIQDSAKERMSFQCIRKWINIGSLFRKINLR